MKKEKSHVKVYGGLALSPSFEDGDYRYYPMANGAVWCESKHESCGWSVTRDSNEALMSEALERWFSLADKFQRGFPISIKNNKHYENNSKLFINFIKLTKNENKRQKRALFPRRI